MSFVVEEDALGQVSPRLLVCFLLLISFCHCPMVIVTVS
jgi:hypothetical protein